MNPTDFLARLQKDGGGEDQKVASAQNPISKLVEKGVTIRKLIVDPTQQKLAPALKPKKMLTMVDAKCSYLKNQQGSSSFPSSGTTLMETCKDTSRCIRLELAKQMLPQVLESLYDRALYCYIISQDLSLLIEIHRSFNSFLNYSVINRRRIHSSLVA